MEAAPAQPVSALENAPVEVRDLIFSFLNPLEIVEYAESGTRIVQAMVLMHVSRWCRAAILHAKFWLHVDFVFERLIPGIFDMASERRYRPLRQLMSLCESLLADPVVVSSLKRKKDWSFNTFDTFLGIARPMRKSVIRLDLFFDHVAAALERIDWFQNLTVLSFNFVDENSCLDLSTLTVHLNTLQVKRLHVGFPEKRGGDLKRLTNIEELSLCPTYYGTHGQVRGVRKLLPIASATTLTRLTLNGCVPPTLAEFINLTHLRIRPLNGYGNLQNMLQTHTGGLQSLALQLNPYSSNFDHGVEWDMFRQCECLRTVTRLELDLCPAHHMSTNASFAQDFIELGTVGVRVVAECLLLLEEMVVWAGLDVDQVADPLRGMKSLVRLRWHCPVDGIGPQLGDEQDWTDRLRTNLRKGLEGRDLDVSVQVGPWDMKEWRRIGTMLDMLFSIVE
jgi:hypothetical protein